MQNLDTEPNVGYQIRKLRLQRGFSLRGLADQSGISANAISLIERGENSPTVSSLHQLALALNVPITEFFRNEAEAMAVYVVKDQGIRFRSYGLELENLGSGIPNQQLEPFRLIIDPGAGTMDDPVSHPGQEFVHCLEGEIQYFVGCESYWLSAGDSLLLEARHPHGWCNNSPNPAILLIVFQSIQDQRLACRRHNLPLRCCLL
jgi:transcriptional regulator with XRE-family HTH domain